MDPESGVVHLIGRVRRDGAVLVLNSVVFQLTRVVLQRSLLVLRQESGAGTDSGDLSSEVVLLFGLEEWVGVDLSLQVSSEEDLDGSGRLNVSWLEVWKPGPITSST